MRFFRRRSSPILAALLAIAMQAAFLVAHAHVHPPAPVVAHSSGASTAMACRALVRPANCGPAVPHDRHDDCPLCWSLAASGAGVLPSPPAVSLAQYATSDLLRPTVSSPKIADAGSSPFQARGPPGA